MLDASIGPISSSGRTIGHGNFVDAKAMLKKVGNAIAASQRMVFHLKRFFFVRFFIFLVVGLFVGLVREAVTANGNSGVENQHERGRRNRSERHRSCMC